MAVADARARIVVLDALRTVQGIERPVLDADRERATASAWIAGYARDFRGGGQEPGPFMRLLASWLDVTGDRFAAHGAITDALDAAHAVPDLARSFLLPAWAPELVDDSMHTWLARVAPGERPPDSMPRVTPASRQLRYLAAPEAPSSCRRKGGARVVDAWRGEGAIAGTSSGRERQAVAANLVFAVEVGF